VLGNKIKPINTKAEAVQTQKIGLSRVALAFLPHSPLNSFSRHVSSTACLQATGSLVANFTEELPLAPEIAEKAHLHPLPFLTLPLAMSIAIIVRS